MICMSKGNLSQYHCKKIDDLNDKIFYYKVADAVFSCYQAENLWAMPDAHFYCDKAHKEMLNKKIEFNDTELFTVLSDIFDQSDKLALWYGSFYDDLDQVYSKSQFLQSVGNLLKEPCYEMYLLWEKMESQR